MNLLKDKIKPMYLRYLSAASGSAMVASIFGMVDAMMVGQYHGPAGNAALAVFNPLWSIVYSLGLLAGIGGSVFFANRRGRGDERKAQEYFTLSILYGLTLSVLAMAGIGLFHEPLFRFFGADDTLLVLVKRYLRPIFFVIPCCVFSNILSAYLRNDGNPGLATKAVLFGGIFNILGDYFFVFTMDMGISGAGLATAMGLFFSTLLMLTHFISKKNTLHFIKPAQPLRKIASVTAAGFSTAVSDLAMGIIGILFNRQIMHYLGSDALAVYGVIAQITAAAQCLSYGAGQAAQPIISQNLGARQYSRIRECTRYGLMTCLCFGIFLAAAMQLFPSFLIRIFMKPTPAVLEIAPGILRAYGISYLLLPFNLFTAYYFQAIMKPKLSMAVSLARGTVVSGAAILLLPFLFGGESIWYSMLVTEIAVAVYGAVCMLRSERAIGKGKEI